MQFKTLSKTMGVVIIAAIGLSTVFCCGGPEAAYGPGDKVTIKGRFLDEKGKPFKGREIAVWVQNIEVFFFLPDFTTKTDDKGNYSITESGKHFIWGSSRTKYTTVANSSSGDGPVTSMSFYPVEQEIELPDARLWTARLAEKVKDGLVTFDWNTIDNVAGKPATRYEFTARGQDHWDLWEEDDVQQGFDLPAYIFQNRCSGWRITGKIDGQDSYDIDWSFRSGVKSGKNLVPSDDYKLVSAGKPCYAEGFGSSRYTAFTNMEWSDVHSFDTLAAWIILDLEFSKPISAVAVYDLSTGYGEGTPAFNSFDIYVTKDTTDWGEPVANTSKDDGYIHYEFEPKKGRYVKLQANPGSNLKIRSLVELSAFSAAE